MAVRRGSSYVLNGRNMLVGNSHICDIYGVSDGSWQQRWQHPDRLMRPYRPRDQTIWTLLHDLDGSTLSPHQVEGLVREDRVEVRVLFDA
jgi:hypothetical protein